MGIATRYSDVAAEKEAVEVESSKSTGGRRHKSGFFVSVAWSLYERIVQGIFGCADSCSRSFNLHGFAHPIESGFAEKHNRHTGDMSCKQIQSPFSRHWKNSKTSCTLSIARSVYTPISAAAAVQATFIFRQPPQYSSVSWIIWPTRLMK